MRKYNQSIEEYVVVGLFSGAGGLDVGIEKAGFRVAVAIEIDPYAAETYHLNNPHVEVLCMDIKDVTGEMIKEIVRKKYGPNKKIIAIGGSPCQSWSQFKEDIKDSKKGLEDDRGMLIFQYLRVITELQPEFILFENVSHMVGERHLPAFNKFKEEIQKRTGLFLDYRVLTSLDYGVAQKRERVFMFGRKANVPNPFDFLQPVTGPKTLREQLQGVPLSEFATFNGKDKEIMRKIQPGKCWSSLSPQDALAALGRNYLGVCTKCNREFQPQKNRSCNCGNTEFRNVYGKMTSYYRRLSWDSPAPTICSVGPVKPWGSLGHPEENRGLSYRECARIQGFDDDYEFVGPLDEKYKQIGNAVSIPLAKALGLAMLRAIIASRSTQTQGEWSSWISRFFQHPKKDNLTSLERDFLNKLYQKIRQQEPIPEKYAEYLTDTWDRLSS